MKVTITIPEEYYANWIADRFENDLRQLEGDKYSQSWFFVNMLITAFKEGEKIVDRYIMYIPEDNNGQY